MSCLQNPTRKTSFCSKWEQIQRTTATHYEVKGETLEHTVLNASIKCLSSELREPSRRGWKEGTRTRSSVSAEQSPGKLPEGETAGTGPSRGYSWSSKLHCSFQPCSQCGTRVCEPVGLIPVPALGALIFMLGRHVQP